MNYNNDMAKIDDIYTAVDDYGLITSVEAAELGMSRAEIVQQAARGKLVRVARGVYRMPVWPGQREAPYAIAVKAAGCDAFLYGETVVALLILAPVDPKTIWLASPKRCRRDLGPGVKVRRLTGVTPVHFKGIACQPLPDAIAAAAVTLGKQGALHAARVALKGGLITRDDLRRLADELLQ